MNPQIVELNRGFGKCLVDGTSQFSSDALATVGGGNSTFDGRSVFFCIEKGNHRTKNLVFRSKLSVIVFSGEHQEQGICDVRILYDLVYFNERLL